MKKAIVYIGLFLSLISCEELIEWDQKGFFVPRLVVEAFITNQPGYNYVKLTLPVISSGEKPRDVSGATVLVTDGENYHLFKEDPLEPGRYIPEENLKAVVNKAYLLYIEFREFTFTASAYMVPVRPLDNFRFREDADQVGYYHIISENGAGPFMMRYTVEWPEGPAIQKSVFYHYKLESADVNEFFKPASENLVFPGNARIIRQKYSLSPDHQRFVRSMLSETEWKGGWFDVLPGNLHTNLSEGGAGFFAASTLVIDTVYFNKSQD